MASTIKIKNSSTTGAVPTSSDLVQGELAINVTDRSIYTENASGTVVKLNAPSIDDKNTGATKYLTIDTNGNLQLGGTTSRSVSGYRFGSILGTSGAYSDYYVGTTLTGNIGAESGSFNVTASNSVPLVFNTGGAERARIDSSGNLGIGATSINSMVHLRRDTSSGSSTSYPNVRIDNPNAAGYSGLYFYQGATGIAGLEVSNAASALQFIGTGGAERARIDSSGNLLVGNTAARGSNKLQVLGNLTAYTSGGLSLLCGNGASNLGSNGPRADINVLLSNNWKTNLQFLVNTSDSDTAPVEVARFDSGGNLLVGTTSASAKLTVIADTNASAGNRVALFSSTYSGGDSNYEILGLVKNANSTATSNVFQRFFINSGAAGSGQINANGASAAAFGTYSDERLKENIVNLPSQLTNILSLRPVEFDYKDGSGHQIGFIAQEMQAVYPDVVSGDGTEQDILTVTGWSKTEARLVKAIQEQQAIIESLKSRLDAANL